uniref:Uncharacterized protein n=1 Tax=Romanomermis culicivorax TaxID=13658 RepID=A0A915HUN6_ROMCU
MIYMQILNYLAYLCEFHCGKMIGVPSQVAAYEAVMECDFLPKEARSGNNALNTHGYLEQICSLWGKNSLGGPLVVEKGPNYVVSFLTTEEQGRGKLNVFTPNALDTHDA